MKRIAVFLLAAALLAGCANTTKNIGTDEARNIALVNAGVSDGEATHIEVALEKQAGEYYYDISFTANGYEYEYEVDGDSGDILRSKREAADGSPLPTPTVSDDTHHEPLPESPEAPEVTSAPDDGEAPAAPADTEPAEEPAPEDSTPVNTPVNAPASEPSQGRISAEEAKNAALKHAGYTAEEVYDLKAELDLERGVEVYDVSFDVEGYDFDYEINSTTGEILRSDKERDSDVPATKRTEQPAGTVTADAAKSTALKHAGYTVEEVYDLKAELDLEHGAEVYDVCFLVDGYEFDYEISASTGEILRSEKEPDSDAPKGKRNADATEYITSDEAFEKALAKAGLAKTDVYDAEAELDFEHGSAMYEVSFKSGGYEYEYKIDAVTGDILKSERERD